MFTKNPLFWITAFLAIVLDRITKIWVMQTLALGQTIPLLRGIFHFTHITNTGAAFGLFAQGSGWWLRWLSLIVSLGLIGFAIRGPKLPRWEQAGWGFILGGAVGNGIDRFLLGEVIDFLDFRLIQFPVFNLADISINVGIACFVLAWMLPSRRRKYG
jgi:signal peptidase II